jgi:Fic family protein
MRRYEETHRHLLFTADLSQATPQLWIALGECQSKCEHIARVPLRPDTAARLNRLYVAKGALATTAIEGNTLSEEEVLQHLEGRLSLPPSRQYLSHEIDNIVDACNAILSDLAKGSQVPLTVGLVKELNSQVLCGLQLGSDVEPGAIRQHSVLVGPYRGAPAEDCEYLLGRLCTWLSGDEFSPPSPDLALVYALVKAVIAHLYIAWIHPFGDGNGRTARLLEFAILVGAGVPAASTDLLSNHYHLTRTAYYRELDQASRSQGDVLPFLEYAVEGFRDGLREQLGTVWQQQHDVIWRNYVHEYFRDHEHTTAGVRRRRLVLDLSRSAEPVPGPRLRELSPRLAEAYAHRGERTMARDLSFLLASHLIVRAKGGYRANRELIHAFMTPRAPHPVDESPGGSAL